MVKLPKVCKTLNCNLERQNRNLRISEKMARVFYKVSPTVYGISIRDPDEFRC